MRKNRALPPGKVVRYRIDSLVLAGNPLGDPSAREVDVYLPADYRDDGPLPLLVYLAGFTQSGLTETNWRGFGENMPERLDRLIGEGVMGPAAVAFPDCFTRLGGNQYVNSAGIGRYADFLVDEVVPFVESRLAVGGAGRRACLGKSYGGYGALLQGMHRPDMWSAIAAHSAYMGFEQCYWPDLAIAADETARFPGIDDFLTHVANSSKPTDREIVALAILAMAATYDPNPHAPRSIRLPIDPATAMIIPERWNNWLRCDPIRLAEAHAANLRRLKALYLDCGSADQYQLHFGARRLHQILKDHGVRHTYEEFAGGHDDAEFRLDRSLPFLEQALRIPRTET